MLFGIEAPKIIVNIDTTQDEVLLDYSVILKDEPEQDTYSVKAVRTGKKVFTNAGKHWIFEVKIHLWKYADPKAKYFELKGYEATKVYLARFRDGGFMTNGFGQTAEFYLVSVSEKYLDENLKKDVVVLKFISVDYIVSFQRQGEWIEVQPVGDSDQAWYGADLSANGKYMFATILDGRVYRSTDYGVTWVETRPAGDANYKWHHISCSQDGKYVCVGQNVASGKTYYSSDYGVTWSDITQTIDSTKAYGNITMDYIGQKILVGTNGRLYRTANAGTSWSELQPLGNVDSDWYGISCTPDGNKIFVGSYDTGKLFISTDEGSSWTQVNAGAGTEPYSCTCCNSNFTRLGAVSRGAGGLVYLSDDGGTTWEVKYPAGGTLAQDYRSINMDATGRIIIITVYDGKLYVSYDYGETWNQEIDDTNRNWGWGEVNTFGNKFIAYAKTGRLYIKK